MIKYENTPETKETKMLNQSLSLMEFIKEKIKDLNLSKENKEEFLEAVYNKYKEEIREKFFIDNETVIKRAIKQAEFLNEEGDRE